MYIHMYTYVLFDYVYMYRERERQLNYTSKVQSVYLFYPILAPRVPVHCRLDILAILHASTSAWEWDSSNSHGSDS